MEILLGTVLLWGIIACCIFYLVFRLAYHFNIPVTPSDTANINTYAPSIIFFMALSSIILFLAVMLYTPNKHCTLLADSGLAFALTILFAGWIIRIIHTLFFGFLNIITKSKSYKPTDIEISWTWLLFFTIYFIALLIAGEYTKALTFLSIIVAYFFWVGTSCSALGEKLSEIKKLPLMYWYVVSFIGTITLITIKYKNGLQITLAIVGMILGVVTHIVFAYNYEKKHPHKQS